MYQTMNVQFFTNYQSDESVFCDMKMNIIRKMYDQF